MILKHRDLELLRFEWTSSEEVRNELIEHFLQKRVLDILMNLDKADDFINISKNGVGVKSKIRSRSVGVNAGATQAADPLDLQILWNLRANPLTTQTELAAVLGRETRTIERHIRKLRAAGFLRRNGSDKSGHWEVLMDE